MGKIAKIETVEVTEKQKITGAFPATKKPNFVDVDILVDIQDDSHGNDEITKRTCPECKGSGIHEKREESATGYSVSSSTCWLCDGNCVVGPQELEVYAKIRERFGT